MIIFYLPVYPIIFKEIQLQTSKAKTVDHFILGVKIKALCPGKQTL